MAKMSLVIKRKISLENVKIIKNKNKSTEINILFHQKKIIG